MNAVPKRFAASVERISTAGGKQEQGHSLQQQRSMNDAAAARHGYKIGRHFTGPEHAMGDHDRVLYDELLHGIAEGLYSAVFAVSEDRLYRTVRDQERLWAALKQAGAALFIGGERINLRSAASELVATFKTKASHLEHAGRIDSSVRSRAMRGALGFVPTGGKPPFGRHLVVKLVGTKPRIEVDPKTGEALWFVEGAAQRYIKRAAALRLKGTPWRQVAQQVGPWRGDKEASSLAARAMVLARRVAAAGDTWHVEFRLRGNLQPDDFEDISGRDRMDFRNGRVHIDIAIPPLLDRQTLARVERMSEDRYLNRRTPTPKHALNGFLRCECGSSLVVRNYADGAIRVSHSRDKLLPTCSRQFGDYRIVELTVLGTLESLLRNEVTIDGAVRQALAAAVPDVGELQQEHADLYQRLKADQSSLAIARRNILLAANLDAEEVEHMGRSIAKLKEAINQTQEQLSAVERRLRDASMQPEHEAAVRALLKRFKNGRSLSQAAVEQQREALKAMFSTGSLRNIPGTPDVGVFLRREVDRETGQKVTRWTAKGQFFVVEGEATWDPRIRERSWVPGSDELAGVASALASNALQRASRCACCAVRPAASGCPIAAGLRR